MQQVTLFSSRGDTALLEYDPETADMEEVNKAIDQLEQTYGGKAFSLASGERAETVTRETTDVSIVRQLAGG